LGFFGDLKGEEMMIHKKKLFTNSHPQTSRNSCIYTNISSTDPKFGVFHNLEVQTEVIFVINFPSSLQ
jgi:hypothetical protein